MEQIDYVARTMRQLLDFARTRPASPRPVALEGVVASVAELFRFEAERRNVGLIHEVDPGLPEVAVEADQLQQVLVNLVMNACDACTGGGTVRLLAQSESANQVRMLVEDTGCGIPKEHQHQIFDPFFTTKKRGQGTGLGLTIAAQIVRNHGGRIEVESEPGQGTRMTVIWPVAGGNVSRPAPGAEVS